MCRFRRATTRSKRRSPRVYRQSTYLDDVPAMQAWLRAAPPGDPLDAEGAMLALCTAHPRDRRLPAPHREGRAVAGADPDARDRVVPRHGDAADGGGARLRRRGAVRQRLPARPRLDGGGTPRRTRGPRSTCRRSAGAGSIPTLGDVTATNHIVTGVSTHPRGVMPVSGTFTGAPGDYLGLTVSVKTTVLDDAASR